LRIRVEIVGGRARLPRAKPLRARGNRGNRSASIQQGSREAGSPAPSGTSPPRRNDSTTGSCIPTPLGTGSGILPTPGSFRPTVNTIGNPPSVRREHFFRSPGAAVVPQPPRPTPRSKAMRMKVERKQKALFFPAPFWPVEERILPGGDQSTSRRPVKSFSTRRRMPIERFYLAYS